MWKQKLIRSERLIEAHALQAQLEIDQIDRFDLAEHRLSPGIYGLVGKECHVRSVAGTVRRPWLTSGR